MDRLSDIFHGINAREVLQDIIGVGEVYENGSELRHSCKLPFGMHKNGDANPSASLNADTLLFNCFTCGGGSIIWLVQNCLDISKEESINLLKNYSTGLRVIPIEEFTEKLDRLFTKKNEERIDIPKYNEKILERWQTTSSYLTDRGVSPQVQKEMRTGIDRDRIEIARTDIGPDYVTLDRIVLPHFMNGKLVGWVARKMTEVPGVAKYKNSKSFPRQYSLYNLDNVDYNEMVYVVESPMSVLVLKSRGTKNVVATFGAKVSPPQLELLRKFSKITIFMDGDAPGRSAMDEISSYLEKYTKVRVINTPDGEDPASLDYIPESVSAFEWKLSRI